MKICTYGLGHLGLVTSVCLAQAGLQVIGLDTDKALINQLKKFHFPIYEPGLEELTRHAIEKGNLSFSDNLEETIRQSDIIWITFDTPVGNNDEPDIAYVINQVKNSFPFISENSIVVSSSQLPVGTTHLLRDAFIHSSNKENVSFCYVPENLRLGSSIDSFLNSEFFVIGSDFPHSRKVLADILSKFSSQLVSTSVLSAEMTKHAINAFLATCVGYINEIATVCNMVGASASEVESALRCDSRIGKKSYISPGLAFAGGTLARDLRYLDEMASSRGTELHLLKNVLKSNNLHRKWSFNALTEFFGSNIENVKIAIGGLAYKKDTSSIRRSLGVELCKELKDIGTEVRVFDPQVKSLPFAPLPNVKICENIEEALQGADAFVIATNWPEILSIEENVLKSLMRDPVIFDPGRYLIKNIKSLKYITVGEPV